MGGGVDSVTLFTAGGIQHFRDTCLPESGDQFNLFYHEAFIVSCCRAGIDLCYSSGTLPLFFPALPAFIDHCGSAAVDHIVFR
jgi:hypothetical protein